jgi:microcystin-dependent protein
MFNLRYRNELPPETARELDQLIASLNAFLAVSFQDDGTLTASVASSVMDLGFPVGAIVPYGGTTAPDGWLLCDGTAISRATYATLYDVIGTAYGVGNGTTTFNVPDLRQRFPMGLATSGTGSTLGSTGGTIDHTHTATTGTPSATTVVQSGAGSTVASSAHTHSVTTSTGNPPFQVVNYLILV